MSENHYFTTLAFCFFILTKTAETYVRHFCYCYNRLVICFVRETFRQDSRRDGVLHILRW